MAEYRVIDNRVQGEGHPIDLTREEFVHFQMLLARVAGPMRTRSFSMVVSLSVAGLLLGGELVLWRQGEQPDLLLMCLAGLLAGLSLLLWCAIPLWVKKNAGRLYDRVVKGGGTHYGLLRLYPLRVEKQRATFTAAVNLSPECMYIEDEVMQVFMDRQRQAIVLPARCMTPALADEARRLSGALPPQNCKFFGRLQPRGEVAVPPVDQEVREILLEEQVCYTPEEYTALTKALTIQMFWKRAPLLSLMSVLCALVLGWGGEVSVWSFVVPFLLTGGLLVVFNLVMPLRRVAPAVEALTSQERTLTLRLDEKGLYTFKPGYGESYLPWCEMAHVYDSPQAVEFCGKGLTFTLPKRCIPDFDAFSAAVDAKMAQNRR